MELFLQGILCFVFVAVVHGQGYGRRESRPVVPKYVPYNTGPELFDPNMGPFDNGLSSLRGGSMDRMPDHIKKIIGSTISGGALVGGIGGMPRHGGTLNENGMINGWGADGGIQAIPAVAMWSDPLSGSGFPTDYSGQELVFDPISRRYVEKKTSGIAGHQVAEQTHVSVKSGGIIRGGIESSHGTMQSEHGIVKEANHMGRKTIGGVGGGMIPVGGMGGVFNPVAGMGGLMSPVGGMGGIMNPVGGIGGVFNPVRGMGGIMSPVGGMGGIMRPFGGMGVVTNPVGGMGGSFGHTTVVDPVGLGIKKSSVQHGAIKSFGIIAAGRPQLSSGPISVGHVGFDNPGVIAHNVGKATLGVGAVAGHNRAKAFGDPVGIGFINPGSPIATQIGHDSAKATSGMGFINPMGPVATSGIGIDPFGVGVSPLGQISHGAVKASSGFVSGNPLINPGFMKSGTHIGVSKLGTLNPMGRVASQMNHGIAKATSRTGFINPMGPVGTVGVLGGPMTNPIHNVDKVGQMGLAQAGHDPLAARIGHGIAKQAIGRAAVAVDIGSRGGVSAGNPLAVAATTGLAKESLHVAGKTVNMAGSGIGGGRQVDPWMTNGVFGHGTVIQPQLVQKPPPKMITGYGRRNRG